MLLFWSKSGEVGGQLYPCTSGFDDPARSCNLRMAECLPFWIIQSFALLFMPSAHNFTSNIAECKVNNERLLRTKPLEDAVQGLTNEPLPQIPNWHNTSNIGYVVPDWLDLWIIHFDLWIEPFLCFDQILDWIRMSLDNNF